MTQDVIASQEERCVKPWGYKLSAEAELDLLVSITIDGRFQQLQRAGTK